MQARSTRRAAAVPVALALCLAGCTGSGVASAAPTAAAPTGTAAAATPGATPTALWPAPADPMGLAAEAGLQPEVKEQLAFHAHAHLDVFVDGTPVVVPAGIGINTVDPEVVRFDEPDGTVAYGGIEQCGQPCISPLHTHDVTGIIHTEAAVADLHTLGQLFIQWGVTLSDTCVGEFCSPEPIAVYVNGDPYSGDPAAIELTDLQEIAIVIGTPPAVIPSTADFSRA